jgi:putative phage-type endonuclease
MTILNLPQGSPEWLAIRKQYATASDMASILGIPGAFSTRKKIMLEKLSSEVKELSPYVEAMFQRGHEVEEEIRNWVEWRTKTLFTGCVALDKRRGILASLDGVNFDKGIIIECKNTTSVSKIELAKRKQVWEPYRIQILTQMLVTKINVAFLIVKDDNTGKRYITRIRPDKKMMRKIAKEAKLFLKELNEAI